MGALVREVVGGFHVFFGAVGVYRGLPVYGRFVVRFEIGVGLAEVATAEKAVMSGERGGVSGGENKVFLAIDKICFGFGVVAPEEKDEIFSVIT